MWNYEAQSSLSFWQKSWQKLKSVFNSKKSDQSKLTKQFALNGLALWSQLSLGNPQKDLPLIKSFQWLVTSWRQTDQQLLVSRIVFLFCHLLPICCISQDTWACLGAMVSYTQSHLISSNVSVMAECVDRCDRLDSSAIPSFHSITNGTKHIDVNDAKTRTRLVLPSSYFYFS